MYKKNPTYGATAYDTTNEVDPSTLPCPPTPALATIPTLLTTNRYTLVAQSVDVDYSDYVDVGNLDPCIETLEIYDKNPFADTSWYTALLTGEPYDVTTDPQGYAPLLRRDELFPTPIITCAPADLGANTETFGCSLAGTSVKRWILGLDIAGRRRGLLKYPALPDVPNEPARYGPFAATPELTVSAVSEATCPPIALANPVVWPEGITSMIFQLGAHPLDAGFSFTNYLSGLPFLMLANCQDPVTAVEIRDGGPTGAIIDNAGPNYSYNVGWQSYTTVAPARNGCPTTYDPPSGSLYIKVTAANGVADGTFAPVLDTQNCPPGTHNVQVNPKMFADAAGAASFTVQAGTLATVIACHMEDAQDFVLYNQETGEYFPSRVTSEYGIGNTGIPPGHEYGYQSIQELIDEQPELAFTCAYVGGDGVYSGENTPLVVYFRTPTTNYLTGRRFGLPPGWTVGPFADNTFDFRRMRVTLDLTGCP